jgi:hypothetical protein
MALTRIFYAYGRCGYQWKCYDAGFETVFIQIKLFITIIIYIILTIANLKNVSYLVSIITLINGMVLIIKEQNQQNYREDSHKINSF